jgi:hypothetical protein
MTLTRAEWLESNARFLERLVDAMRKHLRSMARNGAEAVAAWLSPDEEPSPALMLLRDLFGLSDFETATLALCVAYELDADFGGLCAQASGDVARPWPTFALALQVLAPGDWTAVSAAGPLRANRLIEIDRRAGEPLVLAALRSDERILDFIKGLNRLDDRLAGFETAPVVFEDGAVDGEAVANLVSAWRAGQPAMLLGGDAADRAVVAASAASTFGRRLLRCDIEALPTAGNEAGALSRLWNREAALTPFALLVEAAQDTPAAFGAARRMLQQAQFPIALGADSAPAQLADAFLSVPVTPLAAGDQRALWLEALGIERRALAERLATAFEFNPTTIAAVAALAEEADDEAVWRHCVHRVRPRLDAIAQRIEPRARWDDLVLPRELRMALREIVDQMRHRGIVYRDWGYAARMNRGLGVSALFSGDSGTGKTMAAEVIAAELGFNLYRVDLSSMVSKYIGETEKNLRRLFDAAEHGGVALLFDEADALFGKRSEVKDSHDRYANIEVNYLLQRIESFSGLAILATNFKSALDAAFMRRLRFVVRFPHPGSSERALMWRNAFPGATPTEALDYSRLARVNLTGGQIAAAAMNAAFLAAAEGRPVGMRHILAAARAELVKLNRPIAEADFIASAEPAELRAAE